MKEELRHYFVDEAGDLTLFNKKGKILVGTEGCSKYFMLGAAHISNPHEIRTALEELRKNLLSDPYLKNIPSLNRKTKFSFHAKDDCPEVRKEVYKLLNSFDIKIYCIIRQKKSLLDAVQKMNEFDSKWRYSQNQVYDACVKRLFKDRLHSAKVNQITFARRGQSDRQASLQSALNKALLNFEKSSGKKVDSTHDVISNYPSNEPCLQVIDYFLWSIQRLYERRESRYFSYVKDKFIRIIDLDDKRNNNYGTYYDKRNELTLDKLQDI